MLNEHKLQFLGPISLIAVITATEAAAHALATWPASSFLWYLNLDLLRPFQYGLPSLRDVQSLSTDPFTQPIWVALALMVLVALGLHSKNRLPLAIASNFSFIYSACLLCGIIAVNEPMATIGVTLASLRNPSGALAGAVLLASALSSTISHRSYWREILA
jgi:hypothetical protein